MPTPAEEAAEATTAAADLLTALADPGVPEHLVAKVRAATGAAADAPGAVFFEAPLAAVKSLCMILAAAKDRPAETRYKPFALKSRLLSPSDVENAVGCGLPRAQVDVVTALCDGSSSASSSYTILVSVALSCGTNVVRGASYAVKPAETDEEGGSSSTAVEASVSDIVVAPAAPSVWAMTPKHTPENPSKDEPWLWCLSRGRSRAAKEPPFAYGGDLRPYPIMTPRNPLHLRTVPAGIPRPDYAETADPVSEAESKQQQITVQYKPAQIETLRKCCQVARGALDAVVRAVRPVSNWSQTKEGAFRFTQERKTYELAVHFHFNPIYFISRLDSNLSSNLDPVSFCVRNMKTTKFSSRLM